LTILFGASLEAVGITLATQQVANGGQTPMKKLPDPCWVTIMMGSPARKDVSFFTRPRCLLRLSFREALSYLP
jgi:hypothetical protein